MGNLATAGLGSLAMVLSSAENVMWNVIVESCRSDEESYINTAGHCAGQYETGRIA